jgi:hypothetical protein
MKSSPETIRNHMGWPEPESVEATIDHAERAQQLLEQADKVPSTEPAALVILAKAQVEATLALAYQQQTANLISANRTFGLAATDEVILDRLDLS